MAGKFKTIMIRYYALLREERGCSEEQIETTAANARGLYEDLRAAHGFSLPPERMMVVVNEDFTAWDTVLKDGDAVVFIPPVAGG